MALSALSGRLRRPSKPLSKKIKKSTPLFHSYEEDELQQNQIVDEDDEEEDPLVSLAIQESLEQQESSDLQQALDTSRREASLTTPTRLNSSLPLPPSELIDEDDLYASPGRLATALFIGGAGPSTSLVQSFSRGPLSAPVFGRPALLLSNLPQQPPSRSSQTESTSADEMEEVAIDTTVQIEHTFPSDAITSATADTEFSTVSAGLPQSLSPPQTLEKSINEDRTVATTDSVIYSSNFPLESVSTRRSTSLPGGDAESVRSDEDMEEVTVMPSHLMPMETQRPSLPAEDLELNTRTMPSLTEVELSKSSVIAVAHSKETHIADRYYPDEDSNDEPLTDWSRSPSPRRELATASTSTFNPPAHEDDNWDAAQEMDPDAEQGEFARFMSQMKGRDLDDVRKEIEAEIQGLKQQQKAAMRDSDDITQQMISQIMVSVFLPPKSHYLFINVRFIQGNATAIRNPIYDGSNGSRSAMC
jgi:DNA excision repair protein ERCC-5